MPPMPPAEALQLDEVFVLAYPVGIPYLKGLYCLKLMTLHPGPSRCYDCWRRQFARCCLIPGVERYIVGVGFLLPVVQGCLFDLKVSGHRLKGNATLNSPPRGSGFDDGEPDKAEVLSND